MAKKAIEGELKKILKTADDKRAEFEAANKDGKLDPYIKIIDKSYMALELNVKDRLEQVEDKDAEGQFRQTIAIEEGKLETAYKNAKRTMNGEKVDNPEDESGGKRRRKTRKSKKRARKTRRRTRRGGSSCRM